MPTALEIARSIAQKVRFSGELDDGTLRDGSPHATSQMRSIFAQHNLQISHAVTPSLAQSLDELCLDGQLVTRKSQGLFRDLQLNTR